MLLPLPSYLHWRVSWQLEGDKLGDHKASFRKISPPLEELSLILVTCKLPPPLPTSFPGQAGKVEAFIDKCTNQPSAIFK